MFRKTQLAHWPVAISLWLMATAIAISAQSTQIKEQPGKGPANSALSAAGVKTGLFVISGGGCNSVLRLSANDSSSSTVSFPQL